MALRAPLSPSANTINIDVQRERPRGGTEDDDGDFVSAATSQQQQYDEMATVMAMDAPAPAASVSGIRGYAASSSTVSSSTARKIDDDDGEQQHASSRTLKPAASSFENKLAAAKTMASATIADGVDAFDGGAGDVAMESCGVGGGGSGGCNDNNGAAAGGGGGVTYLVRTPRGRTASATLPPESSYDAFLRGLMDAAARRDSDDAVGGMMMNFEESSSPGGGGGGLGGGGGEGYVSPACVAELGGGSSVAMAMRGGHQRLVCSDTPKRGRAASASAVASLPSPSSSKPPAFRDDQEGERKAVRRRTASEPAVLPSAAASASACSAAGGSDPPLVPCLSARGRSSSATAATTTSPLSTAHLPSSRSAGPPPSQSLPRPRVPPRNPGASAFVVHNGRVLDRERYRAMLLRQRSSSASSSSSTTGEGSHNGGGEEVHVTLRLRLLGGMADRQNRAGSKFGGGGVSSAQQSERERKERLRQLALESVDLARDPYLMRNHLGTYECKLCLTLHTNEGNYLAHTQGKKHQAGLARRAAMERRAAGDAAGTLPAPFTDATAGASAATKRARRVRIGRPGYTVSKSRDPTTDQRCLTFELHYPELNDPESVQPRHRFMSAYEQRVESPPDRRYQYLLIACDPYETVAFKVPNEPVDRGEGRFVTHWDREGRRFTVSFYLMNPEEEAGEVKGGGKE